MRNRAVEIYVSTQEQFAHSTSDALRLVGGEELEMRLAPDAATPATRVLLERDVVELLRVRALAPADRARELRIAEMPAPSEDNCAYAMRWPARASQLPPAGVSLREHLREFYADAWLFYLRSADPALVYFYARLASGVDRTLARCIAAAEKGVTCRLRRR